MKKTQTGETLVNITRIHSTKVAEKAKLDTAIGNLQKEVDALAGTLTAAEKAKKAERDAADDAAALDKAKYDYNKL